MAEYVLMNKQTGDLFVGTMIGIYHEPYRVEMYEEMDEQWAITLSSSTHDGWILEHSSFKIPLFFNRYAEKYFEVLGEL